MSHPTCQYAARARRLVDGWLRDMGIERPPMPVHEIALLLGIGLRWEAMPPDTTARRIQSPRREIIINAVFEGDPVVWRRRLRQAVAHEIMALRVGVGDEEADPEAILERCASELVLYRPWLEQAAAEHDRELPVIAGVFDVTAEAAAWGLLDVGPAVLTVVDAGQPTTRLSSHGLACPGEPLEVERRVIEAAYETWAPQEAQDETLRVKAWPVRAGEARGRVIVMGWGVG